MAQYQSDKIDTPEKENEAAAELYRQRRLSRTPTVDDDLGNQSSNDDDLNEAEDLAGLDQFDQAAKEQRRARQMNLARRAARVAELGSVLSGQKKLAETFHDIGNVAAAGPGGAMQEVRGIASNLAGKKASRVAQSRGVSGGRSAAVGGALSSALQGEGVGGVAKGAANWYLLYIAFGSLFTIVGSVPALLYLNFHYVMSQFGSKFFGQMNMWQKFTLLLANVLILMFVLMAIVLVVVMTSPCSLVESIGASWIKSIFNYICS